MKKKLLIFIVIYSTIFTAVKAQINIQWQTRYSSAGNNIDRAEDLVMDKSGNVYVTGIGYGAVSGNFDYVTIKYNSAGVQQWLSEYDGPGSGLDEAHAIAIDTLGNVYVTGWSNGGPSTGFDYATVKYDSSGVQQWVSRYTNTPGGTDEAWDIGVDYAGNVFVTGTSDGSGTNSAATTVKYSPAGVQQYAKRYNGLGGIDAGYAIYVNKVSGEAYVAGYSYQSAASDFNFITLKYNFAGVQQWASRYNGPDDNYDEARAITVDSLGNVYVTGYSQTAVLTDYDYATVKYNSAGAEQWAQRYNGAGDDYDRANAIKLDKAGNVYVTGKSVGAGTAAEDVVTIKYNNSGNTQWSARYNGPSNGYDEGKALDVDAAGNVYVSGYSFATGASNDYLAIKYDSAGVQQWLTTYNGPASNADQAVAVAVDKIGNVFITGFSKGSGTDEDYATIKYCQLTANAGADDTICSGSSTNLNASAPDAVSYSWTPTTGLSDPSIANPIANPVTTTSYVVSITNTRGCVDMDTVVVAVVPLPSPAITPDGPTSFCEGGSVTLTSAPATTYQWSTAATDTLSSVTVSASGTYNVTITNDEGCSSTASQIVTVIPLPIIDAGLNDSTCLSTNVNLSATGGSSYAWHPGMTLSDSTIASPVAGPVLTTTYTVIATGTGGCMSSDSVTVVVVGNPALPSVTRSNDTLYCVQPYSTYQWYMDGLPITGATSQNYRYTANGNYYVQVTNAFGCFTQSTVTTINDVGVDEMDNLLFLNVYPNPTSDDVTLELNLSKVASDVKIKIVTITGQVIFSGECAGNAGTYKKQISLHGNSRGIYYLQVITSDNVITKKITKQ